MQGAAVNVLQSLAVSEVKKLADNIQGDASTRESVRAALQAVVGCAGAAAGGSGDCGSAAAGAAASVVLNNLLSTGTSTATDKDGKPLTLEEQQARTNLVASLVAAIASAASADASAATTAAIIETENNAAVPSEAQKEPDFFSQLSKTFVGNVVSDYRSRLRGANELAAAANANRAQDQYISPGFDLVFNRIETLGLDIGSKFAYGSSLFLAPVDAYIGRPIETLSGGLFRKELAADSALTIGSVFVGPELVAGRSATAAKGAVAAESGVPPALRAGRLAEADQLTALNAGDKVSFIPTQTHIDSSAFKVIVGDAKYTAKGRPVGTIFDGTVGNGLGEIKTGTSTLDSSYQLRLQTFGALVNDTPFTIYTSRPVNPTFGDWLTRWGVEVKPLPKP